MGSVPLAAELLRGADWFNDALLSELAARGWPRLTRNQAQLFPLLTDDGVSKSEIARGLGITRQSVNTLVKGLVDVDVLAEHSDDTDARLVLVKLTKRGRRLASDAASVLDGFEQVLADRIGPDAVAALRSAASLDWGPIPVVAMRQTL